MGAEKLELTITPEVVTEYEPDASTKELIRRAAAQAGLLADYDNYRFGSAYYVELPRYIERLVRQSGLNGAWEVLVDCFPGPIPHKHWRKMT